MTTPSYISFDLPVPVVVTETTTSQYALFSLTMDETSPPPGPATSPPPVWAEVVLGG